MRRQREKLHAAPEALLREFLHAFRMVFGIALFAFSLTLFVPAVVDESLDPDEHPREGRKGKVPMRMFTSSSVTALTVEPSMSAPP